MWSGKCWPFCLCLKVLIRRQHWFWWMGWCHQATSHSLSQGCPRFMLPYDIDRPRCVNMVDRLTSLPEWISNHRPTKLWEEIIYPFLNLKWISNSISLYYGHDNLSKGPALGDILSLERSSSHPCSHPDYQNLINQKFEELYINGLTRWGRVTHICVGKLIILGSNNGLSPGWRQAIIWTNAWISLILILGNKFQCNFIHNSNIFIQDKFKCIWKCHLRNGVHFVSASMC